jgi:hypothetical protein
MAWQLVAQNPEQGQVRRCGLGSAAAGAAGAIAAGARTGGTGVALPVGDAATGEVVGADLDQHLVARQKLDAKFGELSCGPAEALVSGRLLEGNQVEPVPLFLLNHTGRFDHALGRAGNGLLSLATTPYLAAAAGGGTVASALLDAFSAVILPPISMDVGLLLISIGVVNLWRAREQN